MRSQLASVGGVESVEVDFDSKTATCRLKPGTDREGMPEKLGKALKTPYKSTGFKWN